MRILHVVHSDAFYGVERYVSTLAVAQAAMGDEVTVIGGNPHAMGRALASGKVHFADGDSVPALLGSLLRWRHADVIHAHMTDAELAAVSARTAFSRRSCVVATRHFAQRRGGSRIGRLAAPLIGAGLDGQISISRFVAERIEGDSVVILPGVPLPETADVEQEPVILVAQRLEQEKSTHVAVRAFAASGLARQGWRLRFAGDGRLRTELQSLSERLGVSAATDFLGRRDDVPHLMACSSILLASAPAEPFGLTVVEAMAAGLPVVAARAGGHVESLPAEALTHGFDPEHVDAAAESLRVLAADKQLRETLAAAGRARHQTLLTPQIQAEKTRGFYTEVMEANL